MAEAGLQISIFYKWRKDVSKPRPQSLAAIAKVLKVPPAYLAPEMESAFRSRPGKDPILTPCPIDPHGEDVVFVGMKRATLCLLKPFIEHADDRVIEVPAKLGRGLVALMRRK